MSLPITLAMFTSCKGHFDKDTYKYTVEDLFKRVDSSIFAAKVVHIKWQENESDKLTQMQEWFTSKGFIVIHSKGEWKHFDKSHYNEHSKDICTLMQSDVVQSQPFVFWMEDDIVFRGESLNKALRDSIGWLIDKPYSMNVRVLDLENIIPSLGKESLVHTEDGIFSHRDCFSFRANVMRSRDVWALGSFFRHQFPHLNVHIERYATEVLRAISGNPVPFACFHLGHLKHIHIGSKDFDPANEY